MCRMGWLRPSHFFCKLALTSDSLRCVKFSRQYVQAETNLLHSASGFRPVHCSAIDFTKQDSSYRHPDPCYGSRLVAYKGRARPGPIRRLGRLRKVPC